MSLANFGEQIEELHKIDLIKTPTYKTYHKLYSVYDTSMNMDDILKKIFIKELDYQKIIDNLKIEDIEEIEQSYLDIQGRKHPCFSVKIKNLYYIRMNGIWKEKEPVKSPLKPL